MKPEAKRPEPSSDVGLDEALAGTFPASDPVSPPSHVEEEMERRRKVLEEDAANKRKDAAEEALDEGLRETFPASDPVAVHRREAPNPDEPDEHKERRSVRRKRPAGRTKPATKKKAAARAAKRRPTKKKAARR